LGASRKFWACVFCGVDADVGHLESVSGGVRSCSADEDGLSLGLTRLASQCRINSFAASFSGIVSRVSRRSCQHRQTTQVLERQEPKKRGPTISQQQFDQETIRCRTSRPFSFFFDGRQDVRRRPSAAFGSGVIVDNAATILTNITWSSRPQDSRVQLTAATQKVPAKRVVGVDDDTDPSP